MTTLNDAAAWMAERLRRERVLYQDDAAYGLQQKFGDRAVYVNPNGNLAIQPEVLKAFGDATGKDVVWDQSERAWRYREAQDPTIGRQV